MKNAILELILQCFLTVLPVLGTFILALVKKKLTDYINTETKYKLAALTVRYVEQVFNEFHGQEKLAKAKTAFSILLEKKGIAITDIEMTVLLESAVRDMNIGSLDEFFGNGGDT